MRLDKWLWAARFYKTRGNAAEAIAGGKVHVNGVRVKPGRRVAPGDALRIRRDDFEFELTVAGLVNQRRPASEARLLYVESEASQQRRAERAREHREARAAGPVRPRRPEKHARRTLSDLKRKDSGTH
ncbi:MAG: RNA-binding protein [Gammaproteobacteria bacterium]|jgi:ribosome-associated heat shock protein Hsp15|nr:RNA-binding protein [Gammaproteobacteria bacterium]